MPPAPTRTDCWAQIAQQFPYYSNPRRLAEYGTARAVFLGYRLAKDPKVDRTDALLKFCPDAEG